MRWGPHRIACLTAETVDILYRLGVEDRIVGVSGFTQFPPEARQKPFVSAFTTVHYERLESLRPDLVICFSDLQADAARELTRRGFNVLVTNQRTLPEMFETISLLGRIVGRACEAETLAAELEARLNAARLQSTGRRRPKVFFEEWDDPLITGLAWVSELIVAAGGEDVFPELAGQCTASQRIVTPQSVVERAPDIIIASWCGKQADLDAIRERPGWTGIPAVRHAEVHEIESKYCLQPGPALIVEGLPRFAAIIDGWRGRNSRDHISVLAELPER